MHWDQGFVTIISLIVMGIILAFSLLLIYMINIEYFLVNSSHDSIQTYYLAESKIHSVLNIKCYYDQLLSTIEEYLKTGKFDTKAIEIKKEHLLKEDGNRKVELGFDIEDDRRILKLSSSSRYNGIQNNLVSKLYMLNDFYEMGIPIVSENSIDRDNLEVYIGYMDMLREEMEVPFDAKYTIGIDGSGYKKIDIIVEPNGDMFAEYFGDDIETPRRREYVGRNHENDRIFLVAKDDGLGPKNVRIITGEGVDKGVIKGTFYIEGDLWVLGDVDIEGILIIDNGTIIVDPSIKLFCSGLMLSRDCILEGDSIRIEYDRSVIKRCGVHIPGFIDLKMKLIKME